MKTTKWIPKVEYSSREDMLDFFSLDKSENENLGEFDKYNEVEVAVIREDNKIGFESAGWNSKDKIILFSCDLGMKVSSDEEADKDIEWWRKVANVIADALNKEKL